MPSADDEKASKANSGQAGRDYGYDLKARGIGPPADDWCYGTRAESVRALRVRGIATRSPDCRLTLVWCDRLWIGYPRTYHCIEDNGQTANKRQEA